MEAAMYAKYAKSLLASFGIVAALATPALSAQFFIVQDPTTKRCTVTEQAPAPDAGVLLGDGAYGDRATAEADMSKIAACNGGGG
jgi:hypothetical protein